LTMLLDEFDWLMSPTRTGFTELQMLMNLGYERGSYVVRRHQKEHRNIRTPAYCPKAMAGLSTPRLMPATKTRMIIQNMITSDLPVKSIDWTTTEGEGIRQNILELRPIIYEKMKSPKFNPLELSKLKARSAQIWNPLLAVALFAGGQEWLDMSRSAADYFTSKQTDETPSKRYLHALYRIYAIGIIPKSVWIEEIASEMNKMGIDVSKETLSHVFGKYGLDLPVKQIRKKDAFNEIQTRRGFHWEDLQNVFGRSIPEEKRIELHQHPLLIEENVADVADVAVS
jgi:hypothetical protein